MRNESFRWGNSHSYAGDDLVQGLQGAWAPATASDLFYMGEKY